MMLRNNITQRPLRRLYFLQQPHFMRTLILAVMYFEDGYKQPQMAKYLGVSIGTVNHYLNEVWGIDLLDEDLEEARRKIAIMRGPLYATQF